MREYLHDLEHEIAALAALAEKGDKQAKKELRKLLAEHCKPTGEIDLVDIAEGGDGKVYNP